jgi:hypothetical protein
MPPAGSACPSQAGIAVDDDDTVPQPPLDQPEVPLAGPL